MKKSKKKDRKAESPEVSENSRTQKRLERRRVVNEDLQFELTTLRQTVSEMLNRYQLKLDAELVQLAEATTNGGADDGQHRLPITVAETMLKQIRGLEVKPAKGRAKDFQRVQELVGSLIEQLPSPK